ncbi:MAG: hypothetical protein RSD57_02535 [Comamonas sp.]
MNVPTPHPATPAVAAAGRFEGRVAFEQQVLHFLQRAANERWPTLVVGDPDFADWPWGTSEAVDLLHCWARHGRQMTVLAWRFDALPRRHPRWVQWRTIWGHKLQCRKYQARDVSQVPSVLWSPQWAVQRLEVGRCTGVASADRQSIVQLEEALQEWIRHKSSPAFPASVLGL